MICFKITDLVHKKHFTKVLTPSTGPTEISYPTPWDMCYRPIPEPP